MDPLFADFQSLSSMTKEKAEKNVQEALNYLRLDFHNLGAIIGQYHPLEILKMAAWEERRIARTKTREPIAAATGRLLPVLLQSIVQSTEFDVSEGISQNRNIKDKDWQRIKSLAEDVTKRLLRSIESYTVLMVRSGKIEDDSALKYRELLFEEAFPPVEDLERVERLSYMTYAAMNSAGSVIKDKYGVSSDVLVDQMYKVIKRGLDGIDKLSEDASIYKAEVETIMAQKRAEDPSRIISDEDLVHEIIKENGWETRVSRLAGERDDFDLFRPDFAANLPDKTYETLSVHPGTLDINEMMLKGLWPATIYPFLRFGNMYFSFVSQHIQSYSLRILQETAGLYLQYTEATNEALRLLFRECDDVDVYTFDGNKVDVSILSSLIEVNAFTSPELFQARVSRRSEEAAKKPKPGHKVLILEPDDFEDLRKIGDDVFASSSYFLIRSSSNPEARKHFYRTIFGQLEMPEPGEYDSIIDPDEIENEEKMDDDVLSDDITDEYEYESEDEDEKERRIEEKEKELEESIPEYFSDYERSSEIAKLSEKYALTNDIIKRDEEMEAEADEYEKELDDDDFLYDDGEPDDSDDDIDPEAEKIYDEAEKDDIYSDDSVADPDQLTFFDELFSDDEAKEADKLADDEFAAEDEEEYEKAEEEAEEFSASNTEPLLATVLRKPDAEMKDFPCFEGDDNSKENNSETVADPEEAEIPSEDKLPEAEPEEKNNPAVEENSPIQAEEKVEEPVGPAETVAVQLDTPDDSDNASVDVHTSETVSPSYEEVEIPSEDEKLSEAEPEEKNNPAVEEDSPIQAEAKAEEPVSSAETAEVSLDTPDIPDNASEKVPAESNEDKSEADSNKETTESLIDKGLVKPVELAGGGRVFVMTEAPEVEEEIEEEEPEENKDIELGGILREIAVRLDSDGPFMSFLLSSDEEMRNYLETVIRSSWDRQKSDGKDKMFSIFDYSISVIISSSIVNDNLRKEGLLNNAGAVMYSRHKEEWDALILSINDDFEIVDAYEKHITPDSFSASNWKICRVVGQQLIDRGR